MKRRSFLFGALATAPVVVGAARPVAAMVEGSAASVPGPAYGSLDGIAPDANGLVLAPGFSSRIVAVGGERVAGTALDWHPYPDGGACFAAADGGWTYVSNSEVPMTGAGGVSALHFAPDGTIRDAARLCRGTTMNCAGGATPWGTWLTCEEYADGLVWECSLTERDGRATPRPALGTFTHEAVAVDPMTGVLFLTEDLPDGLLYRFTPTVRGDLSAGSLEAARIAGDGAVTWVPVRDPNAKSGSARGSAAGATPFDGGEGICVFDRTLVFTTKGTGRVHRIDLDAMRYALLRDAGAPLEGVDNVMVDPVTGDLFVAEDAGNMELVVISAEGVTTPFLRVVGQDASEVTGPALNPTRTRLYFSSQRGPSPKRIRDLVPALDTDTPLGVTYEISGPFRSLADAAPRVARVVERSGTANRDLAGSASAVGLSVGTVAALGAAGAVALRRRART